MAFMGILHAFLAPTPAQTFHCFFPLFPAHWQERHFHMKKKVCNVCNVQRLEIAKKFAKNDFGSYWLGKSKRSLDLRNLAIQSSKGTMLCGTGGSIRN